MRYSPCCSYGRCLLQMGWQWYQERPEQQKGFWIKIESKLRGKKILPQALFWIEPPIIFTGGTYWLAAFKKVSRPLLLEIKQVLDKFKLLAISYLYRSDLLWVEAITHKHAERVSHSPQHSYSLCVRHSQQAVVIHLEDPHAHEQTAISCCCTSWTHLLIWTKYMLLTKCDMIIIFPVAKLC